MNKEITKKLESMANTLLTAESVRFDTGSKWPAQFESKPGAYLVRVGDKIVYVGETQNLRSRMKNLQRTVNHSLRRSLGFTLLGKKASSRKRYSDDDETLLNKYMQDKIRVATLPVYFGRKELEEYICEIKQPLYNRVNRIRATIKGDE